MAGMSDEKRAKMMAKAAMQQSKSSKLAQQPVNQLPKASKAIRKSVAEDQDARVIIEIDWRYIVVAVVALLAVIFGVIFFQSRVDGRPAAVNDDGSRVVYDPNLSDDDLPSGNAAIIGKENAPEEDADVRTDGSLYQSSGSADAGLTDASNETSDGNDDTSVSSSTNRDTTPVTVRFPVENVAGMTQTDVDVYAAEHGFTSGEMQSDGSVIYTMSRYLYDELCSEIVSELNATIDRYVENQDRTCVTNIQTSSDYMQFKVSLSAVDESNMNAIASDLIWQAESYGIYHNYAFVSPVVTFYDDSGALVQVMHKVNGVVSKA